MLTSERRAGNNLLLFAAGYALLIGILRLTIMVRHGQLPALHYLPGLGLGLAAEFILGVVAAYLLLVFCRRRLCRVSTFALIAGVFSIKLAAFHYEAVFDRLPGIQLLFYVGELQGLSASLRANFPLPEVLAELVLVFGALILLARKLRPDGAAARITATQTAGILVLLALGIIVNGFSALVPAAARSASREPVIGLLQSAFIQTSYDLDRLHLREADFSRFLELHGGSEPGPVLDPRYPLCRLRPDDEAIAATGRSMIVLILESVGQRELSETFRAQPLMPNLQRIARENLGFTRAYAPGIKSIQTLTALFSALPPQPFRYYLWQTPLPDFDGWPRQLAEQGYKTAYFHGGDLSFERQRQYLQAVGFRLLQELDVTRPTPVHGWGYDDGTMFDALRAWIDARVAAGAPFLATLFTLSTHDPYLLPPDWQPVFSPLARQLQQPGKCCTVIGEPDTAVALAETYRFLDAQLGGFYQWYSGLNPKPLLLILGDHAPYVVKQGSVARDPRLRFDIPVILAGLDPAQRKRLAAQRDQPMAVHDLPVTLSRLLGLPVHPCLMGPDLLAGERGREVVYAVGPESLQYVHLWRDDIELVVDRADNKVTALAADGTPLPAADTVWVQGFMAATFPVHYYLLQKNAYFPRVSGHSPMSTLAPVSRPLFAAHRANTEGPQPLGLENSRAALDRAAASGIPWLELDVQITADGVPVLAHDATLARDSAATPIASLTLDELRAQPGVDDLLTLDEALRDYLPRKKLLIELKPQARLQDLQQLVREVATLLRKHAAAGRVIIDSFDEYLATSIRHQCACEVGLDMPYQKALTDADLAHVRILNLDWIYVEHTAVDADLIRRAHAAGLKVMAYTVNSRATIEQWRSQGELPDGIITDHVSLSSGW